LHTRDRLIRRLLGCWLIVVAGVLYGYGERIYSELEPAWLELQRAHRLAIHKVGLPQPGTPDLGRIAERLTHDGFSAGAPVFLRIFKQESQLEVWLRKGPHFEKFATYPICRWSGGLGPKLKEGDRQSPEGFYTVEADALNPHSRQYRSFNVGYPNLLDRAHKRTGSFVMVHGGCASIGCFAMTHPVMDEIWKLVTAAFETGQKRFQVQIFPFRLTDAKLERHARHKWYGTWRELKPGFDAFEASHIPPRVQVCEGRYMLAGGFAGSDGSQPIESSCPATVAGEG